MARASHTVKVRLEAEDAASKEIQKVDRSFSGLASRISGGFLVAAAAATGAIVGITKAIGSWIKSATEQEDALAKLNAALASLGPSSKGVSERLQEQASALQKVTKYSDETILSGQALLATFTKDEEKIKAGTTAALDMSAALGMDLKSAFLLMGKAAKGETETLSRYGIVLDENLTRSEKFAAATAQIAALWGGQAAAQAKTFTGLIAQIGNAFGELNEILGASITKNTAFLEVMTSLRDLLTSGGMVAAITALTGSIAAFIKDTITATERLVNLSFGIKEVITNLVLWHSTYIELDSGIENHIKKQEEAKALYNQINLYLPALIEKLMQMGEASRNAADAGDSLADSQRSAHLESLGLAELYGIVSGAANDLAASTERAGAATQSLTQEQQDAVAWLRTLGVVLDQDVNAKLEKNAAIMEFCRANARALGLDANELAMAEALVAAEADRLNATLSNQNTILYDTAAGWDSASVGLERYRSQASAAIGTFDNLTRSIAAASGAASSLGAAEGSGAIRTATMAGLTRTSGGVVVDASGSEFRGVMPGGTVIGRTPNYALAAKWWIDLQEWKQKNWHYQGRFLVG
jgi:hypothetical protein